jgi:hypothetical protein
MRMALARLISAEYDVVGTVADGEALVREARRTALDVVVSNVFMPVLDRFSAGRQIKRSCRRPAWFASPPTRSRRLSPKPSRSGPSPSCPSGQQAWSCSRSFDKPCWARPRSQSAQIDSAATGCEHVRAGNPSGPKARPRHSHRKIDVVMSEVQWERRRPERLVTPTCPTCQTDSHVRCVTRLPNMLHFGCVVCGQEWRVPRPLRVSPLGSGTHRTPRSA